MTDGLRIAHLGIAPQWAILRWAILRVIKQTAISLKCYVYLETLHIPTIKHGTIFQLNCFLLKRFFTKQATRNQGKSHIFNCSRFMHLKSECRYVTDAKWEIRNNWCKVEERERGVGE